MRCRINIQATRVAAVPIVEAMFALVLVDHTLRQAALLGQRHCNALRCSGVILRKSRSHLPSAGCHRPRFGTSPAANAPMSDSQPAWSDIQLPPLTPPSETISITSKLMTRQRATDMPCITLFDAKSGRAPFASPSPLTMTRPTRHAGCTLRFATPATHGEAPAVARADDLLARQSQSLIQVARVPSAARRTL